MVMCDSRGSSEDDDYDGGAVFFHVQNVSDSKFMYNSIGAKIMRLRHIAISLPSCDVFVVRVLIFHLSALLYENAVIAYKHFSTKAVQHPLWMRKGINAGKKINVADFVIRMLVFSLLRPKPMLFTRCIRLAK